MRIKVSSIGCRLNEYEIQSVLSQLKHDGHIICEDEDWDIEIINSCVVTQKSEAKTRNLINRSNKMSNSQRKLIVTGCFAKKIEKIGQSVYLPNDYKCFIPQIVNHWDLADQLDQLEPSRFKYHPPVDASTTRVNLKIQDGCDHFCTYCIIPIVRGKPVSKTYQDVVNEFKTLLASGYKEIVLTGISIGQYQDNELRLSDLIEDLLNIEGDFRIHLSSIDPDLIDQRLLKLLPHERMVRHLHISLQSGSNEILKKMNRRYTREEFMNIVNQIRSVIPDYNLTTDVIAGFPTETNQDHADTLEIIKNSFFSHVHTFRYSPRPMTAAANMKETVGETVKKARSQEIMELSVILKKKYYSQFHGKKLVFLGEKVFSGKISGHCNYYLPIEVYENLKPNEFVQVKAIYDEKENKIKGESIH